jgi:SlyX protein
VSGGPFQSLSVLSREVRISISLEQRPAMTTNTPTPEERVTELETVVMHLQRQMEQLNEVVIDHRAALDVLKQQADRLEHQLEQTDESPEQRDPLDEVPPHY